VTARPVSPEGAQETTDTLREQVAAALHGDGQGEVELPLRPDRCLECVRVYRVADVVLAVVAPELAAAEQRGRKQGWDEDWSCPDCGGHWSADDLHRVASPAPAEEGDR